jgi:hypothetical protein
MFAMAQDWLVSQGLDSTLATVILRLVLGFAAVLVAWIAWLVARRIVRRVVGKLITLSSARFRPA